MSFGTSKFEPWVLDEPESLEVMKVGFPVAQRKVQEDLVISQAAWDAGIIGMPDS